MITTKTAKIIIRALAFATPLVALGLVVTLFSRPLSSALLVVAVVVAGLAMIRPELVAPMYTYGARHFDPLVMRIIDAILLVFFSLVVVPAGLAIRLLRWARTTVLERKQRVSTNWIVKSPEDDHGP